MKTILLIIGTLLPLYASAVYSVSIVKGATRPHRMTRFLLLVLTAVMTLSLRAGGDTSGVWLALVSFVQAVGLFGLSLWRGVGGRDRLDIACLVLCMAGVAWWLLADLPWVGLTASIVADMVAMLPALRKTIRMPHTEIALFYGLDTLAGLLILVAGPFRLQAVAFPLYIALINMAFVVAIRWPRREGVLADDIG
jgi:hypothetical protein